MHAAVVARPLALKKPVLQEHAVAPVVLPLLPGQDVHDELPLAEVKVPTPQAVSVACVCVCVCVCACGRGEWRASSFATLGVSVTRATI